jgi:Na+/proline symporter
MPGDEVFPRYVVARLPAGLAGLAVAGLLAAAMSTVSSSLNSLASASTHDFYAPLLGREGDERHLLKAGRGFTLLWAVVLVGGALLYRQRETPVVVVALSVASLTYGALLGTFLLARLAAVSERGATVALLAASALMGLVVFAGPLSDAWGRPAVLEALRRLAWPWYVPVGTLLTLAIGWLPAAGRAVARLANRRTETGHGVRRR